MAMGDEDRARIAELERQMAFLLRELGLEQKARFGAATSDDAIAVLLRSGRKIEAIKLWRERTGLGLKEAKDAVEALERQLGGR